MVDRTRTKRMNALDQIEVIIAQMREQEPKSGPKPIFVYVEWSESNTFESHGIYKFGKFEILALSTAKHYKDLGYLKTKIRVLFDSGDEYACRIDLADHDEHGFQHHCSLVTAEYLGVEASKFINSINWG